MKILNNEIKKGCFLEEVSCIFKGYVEIELKEKKEERIFGFYFLKDDFRVIVLEIYFNLIIILVE